jgi:hypothetical protein
MISSFASAAVEGLVTSYFYKQSLSTPLLAYKCFEGNFRESKKRCSRLVNMHGLQFSRKSDMLPLQLGGANVVGPHTI